MGETEAKEKVAVGAEEIIARAIKHSVSDIHIEPGPRFVAVRYRQGGTLYVANKLPLAHAGALAKHLKQQAKLDINNTAEPQIGNYELKLGRRTYEAQIATLPVIDGEKVTIKLRELSASMPDPKRLGLWGKSLDELNRAMASQRGLLLIACRQPHHINLMLASLLESLASPVLKTAFINNDNHLLPLSIKQVAVKPAIGLDISAQLMILGHEHFDVLGVSIIDSKKTAQAVHAASAHGLVVAGFPFGTAVAALAHYDNLQATTYDLPMVLGQVFVRRLCDNCRESYHLTAVEREKLNFLFHINSKKNMGQISALEKAAKNSGIGDGPLNSNESEIKNLWRAQLHGCRHCDHTGYSGEIGIFEFCQPGPELQKAVRAGKTVAGLQKQAISDGMVSLRVDALIKALRSQVDLSALLSVCAIKG